ncbi:uncharacterized protein E6C27_scaffold115G00630 [Cucumis melo var. makuwa]|uniref:SWIM-type domain-containing protein n=1 Tax=Cucumis melo var. makuwa TaxID=1194695 RepID=A0A5A7U1T3_CUCMM|nr:uncharacterized protein E6C27_scaffold115G00630 [Cucumis melo var. makuwa]
MFPLNCFDGFATSEDRIPWLTLYWKDGNNSKLIRIVDDKDVSWIMLVLSKLTDNDLLIVVDTAPATDIGNTSYMSSKVPRTEDSRTENAPCRPSDVIYYMKIHHGVNISYDKAWRGREIALNSIRGTYTAEEVDDEGWFKFYFMALAASIDAWNYCVPVISVDGAAMKNKYLGTLISACTIDGNSQIVPLAFVVVDSENDLSWSWFFETLKPFLGNIMRWRKRYQVITTNISESMKSTLKEQRELPVIGLLESIRSLIQKWFYERRTKWSFQYTQLSIYAEDMIRESLAQSRSMNIYPVDQHEFEVHHCKEQFVVNILNRTCSCRQWDLDLIPCSHACIALSTRNLNLHLYTNKFYYVSNLINLYKKGTRPIGTVNQIRNTHQGGNDGILPPQVKRPAGRPKKKRFTSFLEKKASVRCSRCGKKGHNCRFCKEPI